MHVDATYEATRRRHFAYAMELFPSYMARLRWSRAEIVAEQTDALRALLRHAIASSSWSVGLDAPRVGGPPRPGHRLAG